MKKYVIKMSAVLLFTVVAVSSCSLEYRQNRMHGNDQDRHSKRGHDRDRDRDHHDNDNRQY
jgi:hypothetical protein